MGKINNITLYSKLTSATISVDDYVIGTKNSTGLTNNFPLGTLLTLASTAKVIDNITLSSDNDYQNDLLIDATGVWAFFQGEQMNTANLISSFDSVTGTVVFVGGPYTGELNLLYF